MAQNQTAGKSGLNPYLSLRMGWALSLGTSIGWGSLVITSSTYLSQAGPAGSILGLIIGAVVMLVMAKNYHYMMKCFPDSGGAYAFARDAFGYDHGFLSAWFLALTYLAMLWANATSLPLFSRYFIGELFRFGRLYTIFGYEVYLGETLLTVAAILLVAGLCMRGRRALSRLMVGMAGFFTAGIALCFAAAMLRMDRPFAPAYVPDAGALSQVLKIAAISPWAFIGFENISHGVEEFRFSKEKIFRVLAISVISAATLYICITLLSVSAYPPEYATWLEYIRDLGSLSGIKGLPAFYAADHYLGQFGVSVLMLSLLCLIVTSLIGNIFALSRLFFALGRDEVLPKGFAQLNDRDNPERAILLVAAVSVVVPLLGRTAIGWIVDVTTLGATIIYGIVAAATWKTARFRGDRAEKVTGLVGLLCMFAIGAYLLIPNLFTTGTMETESFFLFAVWSILGFLLFRVILLRDKTKRFGRSIIVWISLLSLILFVSLVWMSQSTIRATTRAMSNVHEHYIAAGFSVEEDGFALRELDNIRRANARSIAIVIGMFALSLGVLLNNYSLMSRRAQESEAELGLVKRIASTDPLTGVKSKHAYAHVENELNARIQAGEAEPFAVAVCDVNGLKYINDTLGHKAGDEYILSASTLICDLFLHSPVYRVGGDEFVILLTDRDYENRSALVAALNRRVEDNLKRGEVVVAAGVSEYVPGEDRALRGVFERADALMYQRKRALKAMGARTR